jgi:hypothetical protein
MTQVSRYLMCGSREIDFQDIVNKPEDAIIMQLISQCHNLPAISEL